MTHLKTATLLSKTPHSHISSSVRAEPSFPPRRDIMIVRGIRGTRTLFSCTWNEKRKKDMDEVNSAMGNSVAVGAGSAPEVCV